MNKPSSILALICSVLVLLGCRKEENNKNPSHTEGLNTKIEKLVPIDFRSLAFSDLQPYTKDTLTSTGWTIRYLVKDDSTKYNDIYIECSKGNLKGTFQGKDILQLRRYFIPIFIGESDSYIYFKNGCATDCLSILCFSKRDPKNFTEFTHIVDYRIDLDQILYVTDGSFEDEENGFELALTDLSKGKIRKVVYQEICKSPYKTSCIDTVIFSGTSVEITTNLFESLGNTTQEKRTRIIQL